ncbi:MAG: ferrous iron transport protein B [Campylobacterales bacterium]|nr:ferrous iron transport protein B [Campylobacterales bacterium]
MNKIKVALVGQPNVGKSHLINSITGATLHVGNFSGVTVEKKEVVFTKENHEITITDLPGLYSLNAYSPDEQVTKDYIINQDYDLIVNVVDANALQRNLALTLQLLDSGKKVVLAINMIDEIEKIGGSINGEEISKLLGIPVVLVSAKQKKGIDKLTQKILEMYTFGKPSDKIQYDINVENSIKEISDVLEKGHFEPKVARFYAIRLFENDEDIYKKIHDKPIFLELHDKYLREKDNIATLHGESDSQTALSGARVSVTKFICQKALSVPHLDTSDEKVDNLLIHRMLGLPIFLFLMWGLFQATFLLGEYPMGLIEEAFGFLSEKSAQILPEGTFSSAISEGFIPAVGAILSFLPNILILFMGLNLLEQTGYMARAAYLLDGTLKKFGLHGKAFIPMVTGFGCSVPAYMAARTLKNPKDKLITMLVISFFSCSARLPVYVLFISAFFESSSAGNILFLIYIGGAIMGLIMAKILRLSLFKGEAEPFVMEMPKYRFPSIKGLFRDLQIKAMIFIKKAGIFIGLTSIVIWLLSAYPKNEVIEAEFSAKIENAINDKEKAKLEIEMSSALMEQSYIGVIGKAIQPIFAPLGFDWKLSVATVTALAAKEVAVATLATLNKVEATDEPTESLIATIRESVDFKTAMAFMVIIMIYSPCLAAMSTFLSEVLEVKWRVFYILYPNILAWILAYLTYNVLAILGF